LVIAITVPPLYLRHGLKILFLAGLIGQLGITPGLLNAPVTQQNLETLQTHAGVEKLRGKGVAKGMQGISLVR
jgi:hypothetical protein